MSEAQISEATASALAAERTILALELPQTLAVIARFAATDVGRERLQTLRPESEAKVRLRRAQLVELQRVLAVAGGLVPSQDQPLADWLPALESVAAPLDGRDIFQVGCLLEIFVLASATLRGAEPPCPAWAERFEKILISEEGDSIGVLEELASSIRRVLDSQGEVRPDASENLVRLGASARSRRDRLYSQFEGYVQHHREQLGEETLSVRDGRLSVLLPAGSRGRLEGLVHGRSATGRSFYFEPLEMVDSNNELQRATVAVEEERARLLRDLESRVRGASQAIGACVEAVAELDMQQAVARWAARVGCTFPELDAGELRIVEACHPLLDPRLVDARVAALATGGNRSKVVPLDLDFGADRVLVVTGPNAGGKTVALKTVGLLVLLAACGLPVPAASGTRVPALRRVIALVGDEQDLLADRSTFSARLLHLREVWETAGEGALILLDEVGSGTNPQEGAALGVALLEGLLESGCRALMTTHLVEIASRAMALEESCCLAMEFDAEHGRPTFRLRAGAPGGSEALTLARSLGLPARLIDRAEELLGPEHRDLREMLAEADRLRRELREELAQLEAELGRQLRLGRRLDSELETAKQERAALRRHLEKELVQFKKQVRSRFQEAAEAMRGELAAGRRRDVAGRAVNRLFVEAPSLPAEPPAESADVDGEVEVGGWVRHLGLGWRGRLDRIDGERAECSVAGKRVRCRLSELVLEKSPRSAPRRPSPTHIPSVEERAELHLVGERVEPALERLDRYLDRVSMANLTRVRIVHGHGTGRLRGAVREHLSAHPVVATVKPAGEGEGGNGATVVTLKGA